MPWLCRTERREYRDRRGTNARHDLADQQDAPADGAGDLEPAPPLAEPLGQQAAAVAAAIAPGVPAITVVRALIAWTQLFGMISFELFGQLVGSADPADAFFAYAVDRMADFVGLP